MHQNKNNHNSFWKFLFQNTLIWNRTCQLSQLRIQKEDHKIEKSEIKSITILSESF